MQNLLAVVLCIMLPLVSWGGETALDRYLVRENPHVFYELRHKGDKEGFSYGVYTLTSQHWRGMPWRHQLYVITPAKLKRTTTHAILVIAGGSWKDAYDHPIADKELSKFSRKMWLYRKVATMAGLPIVVLRHVPNQPILDGRKEDAAIAHTFDQYMKTGEEDWPLLLPMTKSATVAMDVGQVLMKELWDLDIITFTVMGASKRGWTTWLTSAVDDRVTALAPMVIDVLNIGEQMVHQRRVWPTFSEKIADYTRLDIPRRLQETRRGQSLLGIVDPYVYRHRLTQPKLIVLGTNDEYWAVDALNFYWKGLMGPKYIVYLPNQGHKARDYRRFLNAVQALNREVVDGKKLPELSWHYDDQGSALHMTLSSDKKGRMVRLWSATSDDRDFRDAFWSSEDMGAIRGERTYTIPIVQDRCTAVYFEVSYGKTKWFLVIPYGVRDSFSLSTTIHVVGLDRCLPTGMLEAEQGGSNDILTELF